MYLHDVLAATGFHREYWMVMGLLLGELRSKGFSSRRIQVNNDGKFTKWAVCLQGLKPDNADACLTALYGDWRTPDSHYVYWRDCGATVDRYPWSGERRRV